MFVKLFGTILDSSIWAEDTATRIVWITLLAMAGPDGVVIASLKGIAHRARVTEAECARALKVLEAPDPDSHTPDYEGRRVAKVDGGWILLNYQRYREIKTQTQLSNVMRQRRFRERARALPVTDSVIVTPYASASVPTKDVVVVEEAKTGLQEEQKKDLPAAFAVPWENVGSPGVALVPAREAKVRARAERRAATIDDLHAKALAVFAYWRDAMRMDPIKTLFTVKREERITARLRENGGDLSELLYVVDGALRDAWTMGTAQNSTKPYNGTQTIFRDREKVEELLALVKRRADVHPFLNEAA